MPARGPARGHIGDMGLGTAPLLLRKRGAPPARPPEGSRPGCSSPRHCQLNFPPLPVRVHTRHSDRSKALGAGYHRAVSIATWLPLIKNFLLGQSHPAAQRGVERATSRPAKSQRPLSPPHPRVHGVPHTPGELLASARGATRRPSHPRPLGSRFPLSLSQLHKAPKSQKPPQAKSLPPDNKRAAA